MRIWTAKLEKPALALLAALSLSACETSPRTELSWNVREHVAYGPSHVTLPPVEQRKFAGPRAAPASRVSQEPLAQQPYGTQVASTAKQRKTPGWYSVKPAPQSNPVPTADTQPMRVADSSIRFQWPIAGRIVLEFGAGEGGERNDGINIAAAPGEPIRAAASGTVSYVGNELKGYGNLILIRHDGNYITAYAHAQAFTVGRGDVVGAGQVIGYVGSTGDVSSPQLHFEIRDGVRPVDPRAYLPKSLRVAAS
jgi:murein DD-endopeptidase MepM/ murein hydrolase activator NlpD